MIKHLIYLTAFSLSFTGIVHASSCPRCDEIRANNLKNKNEFFYYEDYAKANEKKIEQEKIEKESNTLPAEKIEPLR